ncbi:MAG: hypothetical protein HUU38_04040 [Anaerolineales bacterium]|nr:hypothetical protein [Anaerolineales bacterium]
MSPHFPPEITSLPHLQTLVTAGITDWKPYGDVGTDTDGDLIIFNYTPKAQYAGRWNFFERVSRGLILNRLTGEIVARPFDKFYNYNEPGRKATGHLVTVTEKMDGSLGILYRSASQSASFQGEKYRIATRGAFHSDQAEWATRFLNQTYDLSDLPDELTLLFEIIYPENRVIVDYHGQESLTLLAARNRFTGDYLPFYPAVYDLGQQYGFPLPQTFYFNNVSEIIARAGTLDESEEGFVLEFSDGQRFKIKGDKYLELHKLVFGLSFKHTLEAYQTGTVDYIRSQIPDEFLAEFNGWVTEIETTITQTLAAIETAFAAAPKTQRREYALWVQENQLELSPYLFAKIDGKSLMPLIYKLAFQNRGDERVVKYSENTA